MAGIYIHIPFCRQACHYCDFHFSTNLSRQNEMIEAIAEELKMRRTYVHGVIKTIYFGGGTPSLLTASQINTLLQVIRENYAVSSHVELTLEANPEDLTHKKADQLLTVGINRLSVGIQTFSEEKLQWMNRAHNAMEALDAMSNARKAGFENISLDLIYAIPENEKEVWRSDLEKVVSLNPEHISLYGLTIEEKTVFGKWEREKKLIEVPESEAAEQYLTGIEYLTSKGYIQYEVSNFGKEGYHSQHNHAYWSGDPYIGIGPGAHSFDGLSNRRFNVKNNSKYLKNVQEGHTYWEDEYLSRTQRINERILTQLRTKKGLDLDLLSTESGRSFLHTHQTFIQEMKAQDLVELKEGQLSLKPRGFLVADEIALRLFYPD